MRFHYMPRQLLRRLLDLRCTVLDYELVKDAQGRRTIAFGRHAGLAGAIDLVLGYDYVRREPRSAGGDRPARGLRLPRGRFRGDPG